MVIRASVVGQEGARPSTPPPKPTSQLPSPHKTPGSRQGSERPQSEVNDRDRQVRLISPDSMEDSPPPVAVQARWAPRSLADLFDYQPIRLNFNKQHPEDDYSDEVFIRLMDRLFRDTHRFASAYFGKFDLFLPQSPWTSADFSDKFVENVGRVAWNCPELGGWDALLCVSTDRVNLVVAIIARVFQDDIFQPWLFGANPLQRALFEAQDSAFLTNEGYTRAKMRSDAVRTCLGDQVLTERFWETVDTLTSQLLQHLLPLHNLVGRQASQRKFLLPSITSPVPSWPPPFAEVHQSLHRLVARAGHLAICMRWTPTIMQVHHLHPNEAWADAGEETQLGLDEDRLRLSETSAEAADRRAVAMQMAAFVPLRVARTKIAVWPGLRRYNPRGRLPGHRELGPTIGQLVKSRAVYYSGYRYDVRSEEKKSDRAAWDKDAKSLREHIRDASTKTSSPKTITRKRQRSIVNIVGMMVALFFVMLAL